MRRLLVMLAGWLGLIPFTLLLYLLSYLPFPRTAYRKIFRIWCRVWVHALGVKLRLHRHNQAPLPDVCLLIANHPSAFEDIGIPALFDVDSLAKAEVRQWFLVGRIGQAAGTLFVERESSASRQRATTHIEESLAKGRSIALYPEGGVKGMTIQPFRHGVFRISLQTGIPIVPVFLQYRPLVDFYWEHELLPIKLWQIMRAPAASADYHVFEPFDPTWFESVEDYCDTVQKHFLAWQDSHLPPKPGRASPKEQCSAGEDPRV